MSSEDEWWDVLDAEGQLTGSTFRRGAEGWLSGCFHLIVAVCVQREDGSILLTQRAASKQFAFGWEFPGGSALTGESSPDAASRELREEAGLEVEPSHLMPVGRYAEASAFLDFYIASVRSDVALRLQQSEVMAAQWVVPDEVNRLLDEGLMAGPWTARLNSLWPSINRGLRSAR